MPKHGTALTPGQQAEFLKAGIGALTLLSHEIDSTTADGWARNGESFTRVLREALVPPEQKQLDLLKMAATVQVRSRGKSVTAAHFVREVLMPSERK